MKKSGTTPKEEANAPAASQLIDTRIAALDDWRGQTLARVRALIHKALPHVIEQWKWNVPVWSHAGIICTGESYKAAVKLTFPKGASLPDPTGLFNSSLTGNTRRAIDLHEGDTINPSAFTGLIQAAAELNAGSKKPGRKAGG